MACSIDSFSPNLDPNDDCGGRLPMGLGALGDGSIIFKRKFRWTFEIEFCCDQGGKQVAKDFVKVGNRPQIDIEEQEIKRTLEKISLILDIIRKDYEIL